MKNKASIYKVVTVGLLAALVFVSNYLSFPIPVPVGDISRIHLGNVFCLLSGFVMGPIGGGLASGIGAMLYDLTNPAYIASAPFTFVFKFLLAFVCGLIAHNGRLSGSMLSECRISTPRYFIAAVAGSVTYIILYLAKSYITAVLAGSAPEAAGIALITKLATSSVNALLAVLISVPLAALIKKALKSAKLTA
ncbi:MAG: ECF transporter S component [Hominenteromicrobium sp.]